MGVKRLMVAGSAVLVIGAGALFMTSKTTNSAAITGKPRIIVSTFSLLEAAKAVAGEEAEVQPIVPPGSDPHMFSPNPKQIAEISASSLFVYNGAGFESWVKDLANTLPKSTKIVDMSQHVTLIKGGEHDEHDAHDHEGGFDPHFWLDIDNMIKMTQTFEAELVKQFPAKKEYFHQNAELYIAQLQTLKADYAKELKECTNRTLVSNHDAFGYLVHANHLNGISIIGLSSDEQPNAQTLAQVIETVKEHKIKTIFFEALINDNVAQTIAKETGAQALSLQPLENISEDELKSHQTYLTIMRENLKKLKTAMECR